MRARARSSWFGRVEEVGHAFNVQLPEVAEAGSAQEPLGFLRAHARAQSRPAAGERLRHAMKETEAVEHRRHRVAIVLQAVGGLRLDDEERTVGFEQPVDLAQRLDRRREIVDAVADGDEIELSAWLLAAEGDLQ